VAFLLSACGSRDASNQVVLFLSHAECQVEAEDQRRVVEGVLEDLLKLSGEALRSRRYPDYQMSPGAWTAVDVLSHYFVPATAVRLDPESFYEDAADGAARDAVQAQLTSVRSMTTEE
jgi:hypothetical protein